MAERYRRSSGTGLAYANPAKMENEFTPKKTMIIMVIVVACFAVLWPRIFYPMLYGSVSQQIKPSAIDKTTGCCYVLSDTDVDTIKIMSELCGKIIKEQIGAGPLTGRQIMNVCQDEVYRICGIDISAVLQEQVRLGHTTKQILDEIRSLNGSLCLKYNFGVQPWRLGVPHMITLKNISESVRQERSPLVRSEMVHPAFRERGRAIPQTKPSRPHRIIEGKPGPIPGMRPTLGGIGHVVPPSKQGSGSMGIIMPIYTIGIVIFFTYTLMKIICKKHPDTDNIYSKMDLDTVYTKEGLTVNGSGGSRDAGSCKLVVNAMSALLEEVDQEIEARRKSSEVAQDEGVNLLNGGVKKEEKPSVKIMGMETSESCEGGKKWQSADSAVVPSVPHPVNENISPPQEIYLDRTLPAQSQILVSDSATETEKNASDDDSPIVLAGKMTLSVISLENDDLEIGDISKVDSINLDVFENKPILKEEVNHIIEQAIQKLNYIEGNDLAVENFAKEKNEHTSYETDIIPVAASIGNNLVESALADRESMSMNIIEKNEQIDDTAIGVQSLEQKNILEGKIAEDFSLPLESIEEKIRKEDRSFTERIIEPGTDTNDTNCDIVEKNNEKIENDLCDVVQTERKGNPKDDVTGEASNDPNIEMKINKDEIQKGVESRRKEIYAEDPQFQFPSNIMGTGMKCIPNETINSTSTTSKIKDIDSIYSHDDAKTANLIETQEIESANSNNKDSDTVPYEKTIELPQTVGSHMLNSSAKSTSDDIESTELSGSNQGSVIEVNTRYIGNEDNEEDDEEEVSEEESEIEYEEEEIIISEEEEVDYNNVKSESLCAQLGDTESVNVEFVNGNVIPNGSQEAEESEGEEIIEEIIEEYSDDDEENLETNSD